MNRREFIQKTGILAAGLSANQLPTAWGADVSKLTILHTNDTHSRIEPFPENHAKYAGMAGVAARASLLAQIRKEEKNVLLLDAGDFFQGTPYFNFFGGEAEIKALSALQYDVVTLGNHDFDAGLSGLIKQLPHAHFEITSANYLFEEQALKEKVKPYTIVQKGNLRIGVFGLGVKLEGLVPTKLYGNTRYEDPITTARQMVQTLKSNRVHYIICLSHLGYEYDYDRISDKKIAEQVDGIDLIVGGHTHTFLSEPTVVTHPVSGHRTLINQVGFAGIHLGRIDVFFASGKARNAQSSSLAVR